MLQFLREKAAQKLKLVLSFLYRYNPHFVYEQVEFQRD